MASYHCTVRVGSSGKGAAHAAYIAREDKYAAMLERGTGERLEHVEHGNMPTWAKDRAMNFWEAADAYERKNGAVYREIEVALPRELTAEQRKELVRDFVRQEIGDKHAYSVAIHCPRASLEKGEQPHAHIMYSERTIDGIDRDPDQYFKRYNAKAPEKGGCQKDSAGTQERLQATRQRWAEKQNEHLARHGHQVRVDHRSLKDQGIEREPERHLGPRLVKSMVAAEVADLLAARAAEGQRERAQQELSRFDLSGDVQKAQAERQAQKAAPTPDDEQRMQQLAARFQSNHAATEKLKAAAKDFEARQAQQQRDREAKATQEKAQGKDKLQGFIEAMREKKAQEQEQERQREAQQHRPKRGYDGPDFHM